MKNLDAEIPPGGIILPVYHPHPEMPRLLQTIMHINETALSGRLTVVVVDDGSPVPISLPESLNSRVQMLTHKTNRGKGAAIKTGAQFLLSQFPVAYIITLDADFQHPPEFIPSFVNMHLKEGYHLVIGYRQRSPRVMPFHRILSNTLTSLIISLTIRQYIRDSQCGFRLYDARLLSNVPVKEDGFHFESEILVRAGWQGYRVGFVPIPTIYNNSTSAIRNLPDTWQFIRVMSQLYLERLFTNV